MNGLGQSLVTGGVGLVGGWLGAFLTYKLQARQKLEERAAARAIADRDVLAEVIIAAAAWLPYARKLPVAMADDGSVTKPDPPLQADYNTKVAALSRTLTIGELTFGNGPLVDRISALSDATRDVGIALSAIYAVRSATAEEFIALTAKLEQEWATARERTLELEEAGIAHVSKAN